MKQDPLIESRIAAGTLDLFDRYFVRTLRRIAPGASERALLAAALTRRAVSDGHVCLDLRRLAGEAGLSLEDWRGELAGSGLVGDGHDRTPLVLEGHRLYLERYRYYEEELCRMLRERLAQPVADFDRELFGRCLELLMPEGTKGLSPRQREVCAAALALRLGIITGGPGTGKTTIIAGMLALFVLYIWESEGRVPRILLLAPTGKAAARLAEAIGERKAGLKLPEELLAALPEQASTIHRALGLRSGQPFSFRYRADNPLPCDLVVLDEASMVDIALMNRLFAAVPPDARLVLLGDRDQLASVEAGSILGDICAAAKEPTAPAALTASVMGLSESFRFSDQEPIGRLAALVKAGNSTEAIRLCRTEGADSLRLLAPPSGSRLSGHPVARLLLAGYRPFLEAKDPATALQCFGRFRLLSALRRGPFGVEGLNRLVEGLLAEEGLLRPLGRWYRGRPVLIRANNHRLALYNGDIGLVWPAADGGLRVFFPGDGPQALRSFAPGQLPEHETAFALTVHKSQGSEFDELILVLPQEGNALLSRELLYTAITRARKRVTLLGREAEIAAAIGRRLERSSGIKEKLVRGAIRVRGSRCSPSVNQSSNTPESLPSHSRG